MKFFCGNFLCFFYDLLVFSIHSFSHCIVSVSGSYEFFHESQIFKILRSVWIDADLRDFMRLVIVSHR